MNKLRAVQETGSNKHQDELNGLTPAAPYRMRSFILFILYLLLFTLPNIAFLFVSPQFWAQPAVVTATPIVPVIAFFGLFLLGVRVFQLPVLSCIQAVAGAGISSIIISLLCLAATGQITNANMAKLVGFLPPVLFFVAIFFFFRKARNQQN